MTADGLTRLPLPVSVRFLVTGGSLLVYSMLPKLASSALELKWMKQHARSAAHLQQMVNRRSHGEPLQYILGSQPFGPLNLLVRPPVLIPRPETEDWTIKLAARISTSSESKKSLLDLGTGSGCIPLLLCHLLPQGSLRAEGVDISTHSLRLATDNAALCNTQKPSPRATHKNTFTVTSGNFLSPMFVDESRINPPYDILTSNPPYIPWNEYLELPRSVSAYEDPKALFGGPIGLDFYHAIARLVRQKDFLRPGAIVALEIGHGQAKEVERIMRLDACMRDVEIWLDPWGKARTVFARF